jgi:hypothetical protein
MLKLAIATIVFALSLQSAVAASSSGPTALAFAAVTAPHDATLSPHRRHVIARVFAGQNVTFPAGQTIIVKADKIVCRESNVAINQRSCALTFGAHTVNLSGRLAHELYATLAEAGVPPDGAAGSIFEALNALDCTIDPNVIKQNSGGGASCTFTPGP